MIDQVVRRTIGFFRYSCGLRLAPVWELDDVRQTAVVHFLETGDQREAMHRTWAEFRRNRHTLARYSPGLASNLEADATRHEPIPETMLTKCSERERAALCLAYECDLSGPEIAESLGCTRKAANLLLIRGRKKVRETIQ